MNLDRKEKRKILQKKQRDKTFYIFLSILFTLLFIPSIFVGNKIYQLYKSSEKWEHASKTPIASIEPHLLYIDKKVWEDLEIYQNQLNKIYNKEKGVFIDTTTQEEINNLNKIWETLPNKLKEKENEFHYIINQQWTMKKDFDLLYTDKSYKKIKPETTLGMISDFQNKHWEFLNNFLSNDKYPKEFSSFVYSSLLNMQNDSIIIYDLFNIFNSIIKVENNSIIIKQNSQTYLLKDWDEKQTKLIYKWEILDLYLNPIINKSREILVKNDEDALLIENIRTAEENKRHYENWKTEYKNYQDMVIEYINFEGKTISEIEDWAKKNNINLKIDYIFSNDFQKDVIISQSPNVNQYSKIIKGSYITIKISKGKEENKDVNGGG